MGGAVCPIACWNTPPREDTPPGRQPPWADTLLRADTLPLNKRAVRIPLECILVILSSRFALRLNKYSCSKLKLCFNQTFFFVGLSRSHSSTYVRLLAEGTIASSQVFSHCQNIGQADQITRASQENCKAKVKRKAISTALNSLLNKRYRKLHQRFFGVSVANACVKLKMEIHLFS